MRTSRALASAAAMTAGAGALTALYALAEARWFTLRRVEVPVLAPGARPLTVLHISDIHMIVGQDDKAEWIASLAELEPDLVINTGDNLTSTEALDPLLRALDPLLDVPGGFVFGSNDYFAPRFKNPLKYLSPNRGGVGASSTVPDLPWEQMREVFVERGWADLGHQRVRLPVAGRTVELRGTDDGHLRRDRYDLVAGPPEPGADLTVGVTHAPYLRLLDAMSADGLDLIMAGHTHGGQVCLPTGALVTNCDLDTARVKGLSTHTAAGHRSWLHVSAGLGTSPFAPYRLFCRPEATLLRLVAAQ